MPTTTSRTVTSRDGTTIAYDQTGSGPALILVTGALGNRFGPDLVAPLSQHFTVIDYSRRGRGDSGDTPPYAVAREIEDIEALIDAVGGTANLYGISSGAVLALEAAARGVGVEKMVLFEPPFVVDERDHRPPAGFADHIEALLASHRRAEAVTYFMTQGIGMPAAFVWAMRLMPRPAKTWLPSRRPPSSIVGTLTVRPWATFLRCWTVATRRPPPRSSRAWLIPPRWA